jgi:hypothetical protein
LELLDEIGVPHDDAKQLYGKQLEVIGFLFDVEDLSISISADAKMKFCLGHAEQVMLPSPTSVVKNPRVCELDAKCFPLTQACIKLGI